MRFLNQAEGVFHGASREIRFILADFAALFNEMKFGPRDVVHGYLQCWSYRAAFFDEMLDIEERRFLWIVGFDQDAKVFAMTNLLLVLSSRMRGETQQG